MATVVFSRGGYAYAVRFRYDAAPVDLLEKRGAAPCVHLAPGRPVSERSATLST